MIEREAVDIDISLGPLRDLGEQGYDILVFRPNPDACEICVALDGDRKSLSEWLDSLIHSAPIYEWSHVGCRCSLGVSGTDLPDVEINRLGEIETL